MSLLTFSLIALLVFIALAYTNQSIKVWAVGAAGVLLLKQLTSSDFSLLSWIVLAALFIPFAHTGIRRQVFSTRIYKWYRSVLPAMSETEQTAIDAGTVWWEKDLFSGRPDWNKMLAYPAATLSKEEQDFLDGPVEQLCAMLDDWEIGEANDLPPEVWSFIKDQGFLGMIIPKEYGGLEFSARAQTEVVMKISTRCGPAAVTVMVPNSLGPGELLLHYGTESQRHYYLPRLAKGIEIPAFGLTGPHAGSDAGGIPDTGVVCEGEYNGKTVLGFRTNWKKRYITLGPICTVLGLAFKAEDPDGLLGGDADLGITCALIPTDTAGVTIGDRHKVGAAFQNGPNMGEDVFVPMEWVIGGQERIGDGWLMLTDCLSVGRAISLPALGTAAGKAASRLTGAYSRIRRQFKLPIGKFEGVEEALARIGGITYRMDAARIFTAVALDLGEKPSVLSAILKYHNTEGMRQVINDAMDVHGGKGICMGPSNYLGSVYRAVPVAITVEGANILTRTMIIFGQGAIRCHPHILDEMKAVADDDMHRGLIDFDKAFFGHVGFTISNAVRAFVMGITGSLFVRTPKAGATSHYYRQLSRMSSAYAFVADVTMLILGGKMKRKEKLSGRLGDVLSHLYMASAVLKKFDEDGRPSADLPLVNWAMRDSLYHMQDALEGVLYNFPIPIVGKILRRLVLPLGRTYRRPSDGIGHRVSKLLLSPSATRDRLTAGMYLNQDVNDAQGLLEVALGKVIAAEPIERRIYGAIKKRVRPYNFDEILKEAVAEGVISDIEEQSVREAHELINAVIGVDQFPQDSAISHREPHTVAQAG
ncbi:MAG: acyl-CoA dehydrogenase [Pseudomonadota bacterium]